MLIVNVLNTSMLKTLMLDDRIFIRINIFIRILVHTISQLKSCSGTQISSLSLRLQQNSKRNRSLAPFSLQQRDPTTQYPSLSSSTTKIANGKIGIDFRSFEQSFGCTSIFCSAVKCAILNCNQLLNFPWLLSSLHFLLAEGYQQLLAKMGDCRLCLYQCGIPTAKRETFLILLESLTRFARYVIV